MRARRDGRATVMWAYNGALLAAAAVMTAMLLDGLPHPSTAAPWWMWWLLAITCAVAESVVIRLRFGRQAHAIALSEVPLAVGLAFAGPVALVLARLFGGGVALAVRRTRNVAKILFNLPVIAIETVVALQVFSRLLGVGPVTPALQWRAVFVATAAAQIVGQIAVIVVLQLHAREWQPKKQVLLPLLATMANTSLGALAVVVLATDVLAGSLLLVVGGIVLLACDSYNRLREQHEGLELLQDLTHTVGGSLDGGRTTRTLLEQTRRLLRAEVAEIVLQPAGAAPTRFMLDSDAGAVVETSLSPEPVVVSVVAEAGCLLATCKERRPDVRAFLDARAIPDAIAVPLRTASAKGFLIVGGRLGEHATFTMHDVRLLQAVADQASVLLENGRLVTRLHREVEEKEYQASHDALTTLPNRVRFNDVVRDAIVRQQPCAVLLLDLNRFKEVNDTLGHNTGDALLIQVAERLRNVLANADVIARLGGDEFGVLLTCTPAEARAAARKVHAALEQAFELSEWPLYVGVSIGIALFPGHADTAELLIQRADVAMYIAKAAQSGTAVYEPEHDEHSHRRLVLAAELRAALRARVLQVHYQPKAELRAGRVVGVEALVRWVHPQRGFIPPDEFIPIAEQTGMIYELTEQVLDLAMAQYGNWIQAGDDIGIAVNVSAGTILTPGFVTDLTRRLDRFAMPADRLTLELTESQVMADPDRAVTVLESLRHAGVRVSIDDFGTGYSSLSQLKRLPVDELKIDRSFVSGMCGDDDDAVIVRSTIDLAHNLGLLVVAEGVEDAATWQELARLGCDLVQGYYLSRPVPGGELQAWLGDRTEQPATPVLAR